MGYAEVVLVQGQREIVLGRVEAGDRCDLAFLDHLLQLQVALRRIGWSLRLEGVERSLQELVELVGVDEQLR